jgi:hypothetical protein
MTKGPLPIRCSGWVQALPQFSIDALCSGNSAGSVSRNLSAIRGAVSDRVSVCASTALTPSLVRSFSFLRRQRLAVGPFRVGAQMEGPGQAVGRDFPALGDARHDLFIGIERQQSHEHVAIDRQRAGTRTLLRIERLGLLLRQAMQHLLGPGDRRGREKGGEQGRDEARGKTHGTAQFLIER